MSTILDGEYGGVASTAGKLGKEDMELRTVALTVFEVCLSLLVGHTAYILIGLRER